MSKTPCFDTMTEREVMAELSVEGPRKLIQRFATLKRESG